MFEWLHRVACSGSSVSGSMEKLAPNLDSLTRHNLAMLSLRINHGWPIYGYWTKEMLLKRLRCWETEWMLCLTKKDLLAMVLQVNQKNDIRRNDKKEVYISVLNAAMTRVFIDVCCSLQYGVVLCVSSLREKVRPCDRTSWSDVAGGVQYKRLCFASGIQYTCLYKCIYGKGNIVYKYTGGWSMMEWVWNCSLMALQW